MVKMTMGLFLEHNAILALADGTIFRGKSIGLQGVSTGEVVFNTAATGYQEILTDPSYAQQIITFTHTHIGNVACNDLDFEASRVYARGAIIKNFSAQYSNWRAELSLHDFMLGNSIIGISDIDTRALTIKLRESGAQNGCIMSGPAPLNEQEAVEMARIAPPLTGLDLAQLVSAKETYQWSEGVFNVHTGEFEQYNSPAQYHVVVYDFGVKRNILRLLVSYGCKLTVVPATTPWQEVLELKPDGIVLSNGPGDPAACAYAIENTRHFLAYKIPLFGICLGHQILALASGAQTYKMKFGHHGANHPVQDLRDRRIYITSQNHGFAVEKHNLPQNLAITHLSLFDNTIQGLRRTDAPAFSFQGHPEASPGPVELAYLFGEFVEMMRSNK